MRLQLRRADFETAARIAQAVNKQFGAKDTPVARAENSALVAISTPAAYQSRAVEFIARIEALMVDADRVAKVVVNERTGTVVMGREVRISPVAVLHGNLSVEIQTGFAVSQPNALSSGQTAVVPQVGVNSKEERASNVHLKERRHPGRPGAGFDFHRLDAEGRHCHSAEPPRRRRSRRRTGDLVMRGRV